MLCTCYGPEMSMTCTCFARALRMLWTCDTLIDMIADMLMLWTCAWGHDTDMTWTRYGHAQLMRGSRCQGAADPKAIGKAKPRWPKWPRDMPITQSDPLENKMTMRQRVENRAPFKRFKALSVRIIELSTSYLSHSPSIQVLSHYFQVLRLRVDSAAEQLHALFPWFCNTVVFWVLRSTVWKAEQSCTMWM